MPVDPLTGEDLSDLPRITVTPNPLPVRFEEGGQYNTDPNGIPYPTDAGIPFPSAAPDNSNINPVIGRLFGVGGYERYQLWPEIMARSGATLAGDVITGKEPVIDPNTGHTSERLIERAQDMAGLAGMGGVGMATTAGGIAKDALGVVPVAKAKSLKITPTKPSDILTSAVENTPGATIDPDGALRINVKRGQLPDQEMEESVRGGVFYLPQNDRNFRHYKGTNQNNYGGSQLIEGETAYLNPLVVKGATGGKAPENAFVQLKGKNEFKKLNDDVMQIVTASNWMKKKDPAAFDDLTQKFFEKYAPELSNHIDYILENSSKGNQLRYALQEAAIASAVRNAGHDGVIGYSVGRGNNSAKPFISEIFDVRENCYPSPSGDYSIHPQFLNDNEAGTAIAANRGPYLRPALKYKDKIYKGQVGEEHPVPEHLRADFEQKALSGEDLKDYNFGFVNHKGQFLTREKALDYAIEEGLVPPETGRYGTLTTTMLEDSKVATALGAVNQSGFYSNLERAIATAKVDKGTPEQWTSYLKNQPGIKQEELDFGLSGLPNKTLTKAEIEQHIKDNGVKVGEVWKGRTGNFEAINKAKKEFDEYHNYLADKYDINPQQNVGMYAKIKNFTPEEYGKYETLKDNWLNLDKGYDNPTKYSSSSYQLPEGENYRELLLTLPQKKSQRLIDINNRLDEIHDLPSKMHTPEIENEFDKLMRERQELEINPDNIYQSSHWDEPNVLAHIRMNDRDIPGTGYTVINTKSGNKSQTFQSKEEAEAFSKDIANTKVLQNNRPLKTFHIEEIQSDWHQAGRKEGYQNPQNNIELKGLENEANRLGVLRDNAYKYEKEFSDIFLKTVKEADDWVNGRIEGYGGKAFKDLTSEEQKAITNLVAKWKDNISKVEKPEKSGAAYQDEINKLYEKMNALHDKINHSVPNAPFKSSWSDLAFKRALTEAVNNGYDAISWSPGKVQAERYDLSKQVEHIAAFRTKDGNFDLYGKVKNTGNTEPLASGIKPEKLADYVGKDLAEKIRGQNEDAKEYSGLDLKIGGEGMKGFYDKMLVDKANSIVKKMGGKVEYENLPVSSKQKEEIKQQYIKGEIAPDKIAQDKYGKEWDAISEELKPLREEYEKAWGTKTRTIEGIKEYNAIADKITNLEKQHDDLHNKMALETVERKIKDLKGERIPLIRITPEMREKVKKEGFALFAAPTLIPVDNNPFEDNTQTGKEEQQMRDENSLRNSALTQYKNERNIKVFRPGIENPSWGFDKPNKQLRLVPVPGNPFIPYKDVKPGEVI